MSVLSAREVRAVAELADALYDFLPGTPHPRADQRMSFPGAASVAGVSEFWGGGSKLPAVAQFLRLTLERQRSSFCRLISEIVANALIYRRKKNPLTRREIERVNELLRTFEFRIPELSDDRFLQSLPHASPPTGSVAPAEGSPNAAVLDVLRCGFLELSQLEPQKRGYAFERTLNEIFEAFKLAPRSSFRLIGEQIDGSFELNATYLVEAKWTTPPIGFAELVTFAGKVESKAG